MNEGLNEHGNDRFELFTYGLYRDRLISEGGEESVLDLRKRCRDRESEIHSYRLHVQTCH